MTIRLRLTFFNAATLLLTTLAALGLGATLFGIYVFRDPYRLVETPAYEAAYQVENLQPVTAAALNRIADDKVAIRIYDPNGVLLANSETQSNIDFTAQSTMWQEAVTTGGEIKHDWDADGGSTNWAFAIPVRSNGQIIAIVDSRTSDDALINALLSEFIYVPIAAGGILVFVLVLILVSYILTWRALRPVNRFVAEASRISESDLSRRLPVQGGKRDEFTRLAIAFNKLLDRIQLSLYERDTTLAAQKRFVADAGHELRTPLTSIHGYARMLDEWGLTDEKITREGIDVIQRESKRLRDLAEGLLAVARGDEQFVASMRAEDLRTPVSDAIESIRPNVPANITITWTPGTIPCLAQIDAGKVRQLVTILLDNAIKYSPSGGTITVLIRHIDGAPTLVVRDTGLGIAAETLPLIFDRFYRADESRGDRGAGLGLAIARQIVEAHGANILVESEPGQGTMFTIRFQSPVRFDSGQPTKRRRRFMGWFRRSRKSDSG